MRKHKYFGKAFKERLNRKPEGFWRSGLGSICWIEGQYINPDNVTKNRKHR